MPATCKVGDSKGADLSLEGVYLLMVIEVKSIGVV